MVSALGSGASGPGSSRSRHFTLTVPLSTQVYQWVPANVMLGAASHPGGVEILPVASCYRTRDKLQPDGPLGLYADFTFLPTYTRQTATSTILRRNLKTQLSLYG